MYSPRITRRPRNEFGGMVRLTAGENGYASAFIETGGWGNTKLKPEVQFLLKRGDGYRNNNSFEQVNGTLKLNYASTINKNLYLKEAAKAASFFIKFHLSIID